MVNMDLVKLMKIFQLMLFVLNPPYSAPGNGMVFVEKALSMMKYGYAAIIIQNSAGSGKAIEFNKRILKHSTSFSKYKNANRYFSLVNLVFKRIFMSLKWVKHTKKII